MSWFVVNSLVWQSGVVFPTLQIFNWNALNCTGIQTVKGSISSQCCAIPPRPWSVLWFIYDVFTSGWNPAWFPCIKVVPILFFLQRIFFKLFYLVTSVVISKHCNSNFLCYVPFHWIHFCFSSANPVGVDISAFILPFFARQTMGLFRIW